MAWLVEVRVDQREDKPFVYAAEQSGWAVVDVSDPSAPRVASLTPMEYAPNPGGGISSIDYLEVNGRDVVAVGAENRLALFELRDDGATEISSLTGDFGRLFAYMHSSGMPILIAASGGNAGIYDAADLLEGRAEPLATVSTPDLPDGTGGFESVFAAYHGLSDRDRFYGAGAGGYHIYDIANLDSVSYVTSANPAAVTRGLSASPSADGRYVVTTADYRTAPVRIFDLTAAFEGGFSVVRTSVGAWANNWRGFHIDHETRWPYVFVAAAEQGLQIFNARDATSPYTVGYYQTSRRGEGTVNDKVADAGGAIAVDVRNRDGLIAVGDKQTGVWLFKLEGFSGWDGRGWGYPNVSSAQDWTNGPSGSSTFD